MGILDMEILDQAMLHQDRLEGIACLDMETQVMEEEAVVGTAQQAYNQHQGLLLPLVHHRLPLLLFLLPPLSTPLLVGRQAISLEKAHRLFRQMRVCLLKRSM